MAAANPHARQLERAYRERIDALRTRLSALAARQFDEMVSETDIAASMQRLMDRLAPQVTAGMGAAASLSDGYVGGVLEDADTEPPDLEDDEPDEEAVREKMGAWVPMTLSVISAGGTALDALSKGRDLASRFADNSVTQAADERAEAIIDAAPVEVQWEGIVQPGSCDLCQDNAGLHDMAEEMYRHPGCNCDRVFVVVGGQGAGAEERERGPLEVSQDELDAAATRLVDKATAAEPAVTSDILAIGERTGLNPDAHFVQDGKDLHALGAKLKTEESTFRKVVGELEATGKTLAEAEASMKDNLRYTFVGEPGAYNASIRTASDELVAKGYEPLRATNFWAKGEGYAGVNSNWRTADGQLFEVQFHTQASLETKEVISHPLYELQRKLPEGSPEWRDLQRQIDDGWREFRDANPTLGRLDWLDELYPEVR